MKAVAALVLVAAVTAAAPSAGIEDDASSFSIDRITYKLKTENNRAQDAVTEVCVSKPVFKDIDESKISLGIKVKSEIKFHNYFADSKSSETCAQFLVDKPDEEGNVFYSVGVSTGETATLEQSARVNFDFKVLEDQIQLTCDDQSFKITTLTSEEDKPKCLNMDTVQVNGNCYEPTDLPVTTGGCVKPNGDEFEYCQSEAKVEVYEQDKAEDGTKVSSPAESLNYNGMLTIDATNKNKEVILILNDNDVITSITGLTVSNDEAGTVDLSTNFQRSTAAYTACPVEDAFTAYTIRDLYILGTLAPEGEDKTYYEFGLKYDNKDSVEYEASTNNDNKIIIDCKNLNAGPNTRCYGFVEQTEVTQPLTVTYNDAGKTNKIIVAPGKIKNDQ